MGLLSAIYSLLTLGRRRKKDAALHLFTQILLENFTYFKELSAKQKTIFLTRLYKFRKSKNFHLLNQPPNMMIEVLVSAAAVQITLGMEEYLFGYFDDIFVMKNSYTYGVSDVAWAGHVNNKGIYISWYHFSFGYQYKNDKYNVGLHEMAHALEYEFQFGELANNNAQRLQLNIVNQNLDMILSDAQLKTVDLFTPEGLQNRHECWAESVELFFENPTELNIYYSRLYTAIKNLLKQDPLNNVKRILHSEELNNAAERIS